MGVGKGWDNVPSLDIASNVDHGSIFLVGTLLLGDENIWVEPYRSGAAGSGQ